MNTSQSKILFFDFDMTLVDSTNVKKYGTSYKEVQKHLSKFILYDGVQQILKQLSERYTIYVVSGNVGSTIKKAIQHFALNIPQENVVGYRQGYPMENTARKRKVLQVAVEQVLDTYHISKNDITYIGDEIADFQVCNEFGIPFIGCVWGSRELENVDNVCIVNNPNDLINKLTNL